MKSRFSILCFILAISACHKKHHPVNQIHSTNQVIDSVYIFNEKLEAFVHPYKQSFVKTMNEVLQVSDTPLTKSRPESLLGNFFADACFEFAQLHFETISLRPDLAIFNYGGLRTSLPKGDLTRGKIFELMPFENELVLVKISGKKLNEGFQYILEKGGEPISNAKLIFNNQTLTQATIDKNMFDISKDYTVLTSDYLAFGGDKMMFFKDPIEYLSLNVKIRDALIEYLYQTKRENKRIMPKIDGRIQIR